MARTPRKRSATEPSKPTLTPTPAASRPDRPEPLAGWNEVARQVWLAGLGVIVTAGDEGTHLFHLLVERGRQAEPGLPENWKHVREEILRRVRAMDHSDPSPVPLPESGAALVRRLQRLGLPTHEEIASLTQKMEELSSRIEAVLQIHREPDEMD